MSWAPPIRIRYAARCRPGLPAGPERRHRPQPADHANLIMGNAGGKWQRRRLRCRASTARK